MRRFHYLQHVPFEDAANVGVWALERGFTVTHTRLYAGEALPSVEAIDWLAVMGGPMNIHEHAAYPWLVSEKAWIEQVIAAGKVVIGICLGAQMVADVLGADVTRNAHKEIGWFPVTLTAEGMNGSLLSGLPRTFEAFHWHGDTFSLPPGARHLAHSEACANQAFQWGDRVLGLQCHLDYAQASLEAMVQHCSAELVPERFVQTDTALLTDAGKAQALQGHLVCVLDSLQDL